MSVRMRTCLILALGFLVSGVALDSRPLEAQSSQHRGGEMSREDMQSRIIRGFENRLVRELDLSRRELGQIQDILQTHRTARGALMRDRRELARDIARFAERGGSDADAGRILVRQDELRAREAALQKQEETDLLEVLSPAQLIRFFKLRDDLVDRIRELERGGRPGGGPHARHERLDSVYLGAYSRS